MINLVRSEILKLRTTHVWWALLLSMVGWTAISLTANIFQAKFFLDQLEAAGNDPRNPGPDPGSLGFLTEPTTLATSMYTSGQFLGLVLAMVLGVLLVTNEFRHKTATATFLATPKRLRVIGAKLITAILWGLAFWLVAAVIAVPIGATFLASRDIDTGLTNGEVIKALLLNGLAFAVWAVFGLGLGTLLKNQIVAIILATVLYLAQSVATEVLQAISFATKTEWVRDVATFLPGGASDVMLRLEPLPDMPAWWVGALVLLGYGVFAGSAGAAITVRRDIS